VGYSAKEPLVVRLSERRRLSKGEGKEVCELLLEADESIPYQCGDWLAVLAGNPSREVERLLGLFRADGEELVTVRGEKISLRQAFSERLSIGQVPRSLAEALLPYCIEEKRKVLELNLVGDFATSVGGLSVADFLEIFMGKNVSPTPVLPALKPLQPRLYSIASSPLLRPNGLRLVVTTSTYVASNGELRCGISSSYLNRRLAIGERLRCYPIRTHFRLPENSMADVIMVGPGAGIAPFVGFLEQRWAERDGGKTIGRNWLFFGDRHRATDFIFEEELADYQRSGILNRLDLAFSRDQDQKFYVQDRIRERGEELSRWLTAGAHFYVCGDGKRMAKDVEVALTEILMCHGGKIGPAAEETVAAMKRDRRYQLDVY
jgi:sulfite reductase (NADPH) flavoprotein alpha-component